MRISSAACAASTIPAALGLGQLPRETSANGFPKAFRGWTSFPLQAYNVPGSPYGSSFFNRDGMIAQARALQALGSGYDTFMFDSGWSANEGDDFGRLTWDQNAFPDFPGLVQELKSMGLRVGVYIVPGAFTSDIEKKKPIANSNFNMGDINAPCTDGDVFPCKFLRTDLGFSSDRSAQASRAWVQSVVDQFAGWDLDLIKFDYLHPKAWVDGDDDGLPVGYSNINDVEAYHDAITKNTKGKKIWLLESYNLDISAGNLTKWHDAGDSYRITTDINNAPPGDGESTLVSWFAVQRANEALRIYISSQMQQSRTLKGYPDLDALIIGNGGSLNGLSAEQRRTYMGLWVVSGSPIYLADDLTKLEPEYRELLTNSEILGLFDEWTSSISPGFFVNPADGTSNPSQLQIWEAGPFGEKGEVVVLLANMGCKDSDRYVPPWDNGSTNCVSGKQTVVAGFDVLQLQGQYCVRDVWAGKDEGAVKDGVRRELDEGESAVLKLTPC